MRPAFWENPEKECGARLRRKSPTWGSAILLYNTSLAFGTAILHTALPMEGRILYDRLFTKKTTLCAGNEIKTVCSYLAGTVHLSCRRWYFFYSALLAGSSHDWLGHSYGDCSHGC